MCVAGTTHVDAEFADICDAVAATQRIKHKTRLLLSKKHAPQLVGYVSFPALQSLLPALHHDARAGLSMQCSYHKLDITVFCALLYDISWLASFWIASFSFARFWRACFWLASPWR